MSGADPPAPRARRDLAAASPRRWRPPALADPPGVDWAAHSYQRTFLIEHGFAIWNNFWYAGRYSFVTYSVLYYPLAALLGIRVLAVLSVATGAFAFSAVVLRQWGASSRLPAARSRSSRPGSSCRPRSRFRSGSHSGCWHSGRCRSEGAAGSRCARCLTLAASPLGFAFLIVALGGVALARRTLRDARIQIAAIAGCIALELLLFRLFGDGGRFPSSCSSCCPSLLFGGIGLSSRAASRGAAAARPLLDVPGRLLVAYLVPTPSVRTWSASATSRFRSRYRRRAPRLAAPLARRSRRSARRHLDDDADLLDVRPRKHRP